MKNRMPDYLAAPKQNGQPSQPVFPALLNLAQEKFARHLRQIESYVQDHPVTGISAAFCIGICLGWFIKRR